MPANAILTYLDIALSFSAAIGRRLGIRRARGRSVNLDAAAVDERSALRSIIASTTDMKRRSLMLLTLASALSLAPLAAAHALLVRAIPGADSEVHESPASLSLWFSEPLAQEGHLEVVKLLLEKGAAVDARANYHGAPPSTATFYSDPAIVKLLIVKAPVVAVGATSLYIAAKEGHSVVVKLLLEQGATIEAKAEDDYTPLLTAAGNGHADVINVLLGNGAVVDGKDKFGSTPLYVAAQNGDLAVVKLLLAKGAAIEGKRQDGVTPLAMAAQQGHREVVQLLLEKGAVVDAKDNDGFTPLARAAQNWDGLLARHLEVMRLLLAKGANPHTLGFAPVGERKTALRVAAEQGDTEIAELLRAADLKQNRRLAPAKAPAGPTEIAFVRPPTGMLVFANRRFCHRRGQRVDALSFA